MHQVPPEPVGLEARPRSLWRADVGGLLRQWCSQGLDELVVVAKGPIHSAIGALGAGGLLRHCGGEAFGTI